MATIARSMLLVLSLTLALGLTACATRTGAPPSEGTQAQPQEPLRIGASISLTGRYDRTGKEMQNGYELWAEQVNATGGITGRQVQFVIYDDTSTPRRRGTSTRSSSPKTVSISSWVRTPAR